MARPPRVVSLVPSITETLLAWDVEPLACTRFCEQPRLRHVGGTKDPDIAAIVALRPDLVVLDEEENREPDARALLDAGIEIHVTAVRSLLDVRSTLERLAAVIGLRPLPGAEALASVMNAAPAGGATRAFVPIWRRPWMALGAATYGGSVLAHLGYRVVPPGDDADRYPTVELADVAAERPDAVIAPSEPYPFTERHVEELQQVAPDVRLLDGRDLFWWGARTPDALARLAASLRSGPS